MIANDPTEACNLLLLLLGRTFGSQVVWRPMARTKATHRRSQARRLQRDIRRTALSASSTASPMLNVAQQSDKENIKLLQPGQAADSLTAELTTPDPGTSATQPSGEDAQAQGANPETHIHDQGADTSGQREDPLSYAETLQTSTDTQRATLTDATVPHVNDVHAT